MPKEIRNKIIKKIVVLFMCCTIIGGVLVISTPKQADAAGIATDYLTISVGYYGMDASQYVEVAKWHWSELYDLLGAPSTANYSYYNESFGFTDDFSVIVSTATGYYLDDILKAADVNVNNIRALNFFTQDFEETAFASFTYPDLFQNRYYYDDLLYNIKREFKDYTELVSWETSADAESNKEYVRPMLALESNWIRYYGSDYTVNHSTPEAGGMDTSTRFRLEYGMTSATQSGNQSTSAKYVYQIGVQFESSPTVSGMPELDMSLGTHTVEFTLQAETAAERAILEYILNYSSSDETALTVDKLTYSEDSTYSNIVHVSMTYTVHKKGGADISIHVGDDTSNTINGGTVKPPEVIPDETEEETDTEEETTADDSLDPGNGTGDGSGDGTGDSGNSGDNSGSGGTENGDTQNSNSGNNSGNTPTEIDPADAGGGSNVDPEDIQTEIVEVSGQNVYVISKDLAELLGLEEIEEENNIDVNMNNVTDSVVLPSARKELSWVWILAGAVIISVLGAVTEMIRYKKMYKRKAV